MTTPDPKDPLADLRAEIAAAASQDDGDDDKGAQAQTAVAEEAEDDQHDDAEAEKEDQNADGGKEPVEAKDEADADGDKDDEASKKSKSNMVPISRLNAEAAKSRKAARDLEAALAEIERLKGAAGNGDEESKSKVDPAKIREEARAQARLELQIESFLGSGYSSYGKKEFDEVSQIISDLGAPDNFVMIAIEATGSAEGGAKAVFALGQEDPEVIESVLKLPPLRMAATLARLANVRVRPKGAAAEDDEDEPAPRKSKGAPKVSKAPAPVRPVNGHAHASDDEVTDDLSEDEFTRRFDKLMDRHYARH